MKNWLEYPIDKLRIYSWNPRRELTNENEIRKAEREYQQLKASIGIDGIIVPLMVIPSGDTYEVIAGRHRLRAAKELGFKTVPISIREDIKSEIKKKRDSGTENAIRSKAGDEDLSKWVFAMYEEAGYSAKDAMQGAKSIDNWFSHNTDNKTDWEAFNQMHNSVMHLHRGKETNPFLEDKKFIEICKTIPYAPKYQYQLMAILVKISEPVRKKAHKKGLNTKKMISLTTSPLPEHPKIQEMLVDEIAELPADRATTRVQQVAADLASGRIKKDGNRYTSDYDVPKADNKVLPPLNVRILDIGAAIGKYLFTMTQRAITKGEHEMNEEFIRNTKDYRIEILKTLDERNMISLERSLRLVKLVTDETLRLVEKELETFEQKKEMMSK